MFKSHFKSLDPRTIIPVTASVVVLFAAAGVWAEPEADPYPGPSVHAISSSMIDPKDELTSTNTIQFPPAKKGRIAAWPAQQQRAGALTGRIIYTSGGHGFHWTGTGTVWDSDRPTYQGISEDLGNQDQMTHFVYHAFNTGATIVAMRPVGNQTNEVIMDNDHSGVTFSGAWSDGTFTPYFSYAPNTDDITEVKYRSAAASAVETATARYTPNIPVAGYYPVYGWVLDGTNRCVDQLYRIQHSGGTSEVRVNHRRVGKGWVYLGTYHFEAGTAGYCEISNQSSQPAGSVVLADAIRFGNGMGSIIRGGSTSGLPREEEASRYWIQAMMGKGPGADTTVYDGAGNDGSDNVGAPLRMAAYMNREAVGTMTDRVFLSFHSNGGGGAARGALGLWNNEDYVNGQGKKPIAAGTRTPNQYQLAVYQGREVNLDLRTIPVPILEYPWSTRSTHDYYGRDFAYGEMRWDTVNHEMDATINEVAFHDNMEDAALLGDSKARSWIGRAATQGLVRYFNQFGGAPLAFAPEPPKNAAAKVNMDGTVSVSWAPPGSNTWGSDAPTGYVVYSSTNGYGFGNPTTINGGAATQAVLPGIPDGAPVYFRIASFNSGGESVASEVLAIRKVAGATNTVLVVNAFDRLDRALSPSETNIGLTSFKRAKPWLSNNGDYIVQHANALNAANRGFDSAANEAVTESLLGTYSNLVWIAGEESTTDKTFSATEQSLVASFLASGKNLMVSGAEVGWDLDQSNNGRSFYRNSLGTTYTGDDAGTYLITGGSGILSSIGSFTYGPVLPKNNTQYPPVNYAPYDADFADTLAPTTGAGAAVLSYSGGTTAAVRTVNGNTKVVVFGFPFECITNPTARANIMTAVMNDFHQPLTGVSDWAIY